MSEPFIAEIRMFGNNFAPQNWAYCDGQEIPIAQNPALFSIVSTLYGGNGRQTFAVPNLQGRAPMHRGHGPGLTPRPIAQSGGEPYVALTENEIPSHKHSITGLIQVGDIGTASANAYLAIDVNKGQRLRFVNQNPTSETSMHSSTLSSEGNATPHENQQPYLVVGFCIALTGLFPSRN